ncbi:MOSC domain-containing protein [Ectobacillus panaciterrae]|uniref:MOSC domain-containing protein n=1 Tax=Ectobacillus panaciterrae TaxID=363872 RepID=UPI000684C609|nr:3-alpha domain-containing protein [Ectobacillus panaciterrae]
MQISQPRQPCFKLAKRYNVADLPIRFQNTGYTGFYFRVLKEGWVETHSTIDIIQRHPRKITVEFANHTMHQDKKNFEAIEEILEIDALSSNWRKTLTKRLDGIEVDTKARLRGVD